jgi:hypothetical protein
MVFGMNVTTDLTFTFEMQATYQGVDDSKHYIALGFSSDDKMGDDGVVICGFQPKTADAAAPCAKFWNVDKGRYLPICLNTVYTVARSKMEF